MNDASALELNMAAISKSLAEVDHDPSLTISTEKLEGRQRRILASISIPCSVEDVWQVLTDYDHLAEFIPNLSASRRLESSERGTLLEQIGSQCFLNIQFCARVVLNMVEQFPHRIGFTMVEGDFKTFEGTWNLEPEQADSSVTRLIYDVKICPPRAIPTVLIERHLRNDLTHNLQAIRQHTIAISGAA